MLTNQSFPGVWADFQTAGRGQRGDEWHSRKGENLTFSVVLEPTFVPIAEQFSVSEVVALSLVDMLAEYGIDAKIKWTNDIYVGDKKLVGILIEHSLAPSSLRRTIVGVGINVNQTEFVPMERIPTSMKMLTGYDFDVNDVTNSILINFVKRYSQIVECDSQLADEYKQALMGWGVLLRYKDASGTFNAVIEDVEPDTVEECVDAPIYDLFGRRIVAPTAPGIYIIDGKKKYIKK